jgi:hypothetical protein
VKERTLTGAQVRRPVAFGCAAAIGSLVYETGPRPGRSGGRRRRDQGGAAMSKSQSRRWRPIDLMEGVVERQPTTYGYGMRLEWGILLGWAKTSRLTGI